ncbi:MAG: entericidin [Pseudomonadota bacterium]
MKALIAALAALPLLAACNTIEGIGEDVEATGKVVKETAQDVEEDITD